METHLRADLFEASGKEVVRAHPCLDRPEGMLDGLTTDTHLGDVFVQIFGKQNTLLAIFTLDETLHIGGGRYR
jgi:hypothetical protein